MEYWQLKQRQSLPLEAKVVLSQKRIQQFYDHFMGEVYISFSGGKDSTVLLDLVRELYPNVPAVFVDTGLEYPEIKEFVRSIDNVTTIRPKMPFNKVIEKYGYPVVSKKVARMVYELQNPKPTNAKTRWLYTSPVARNGSKNAYWKIPKKWESLVDADFKVSNKCCDIMKKKPFREYEKISKKKTYTGTMAVDSSQREISYLRTGCNSFIGQQHSQPMAFWLESDVWEYMKSHNLSYSKIYDMGVSRTGCMFCMFGVHMEKGKNRFQLMKESHPKQYDYCINKLGCGKVLDYINVKY